MKTNYTTDEVREINQALDKIQKLSENPRAYLRMFATEIPGEDADYITIDGGDWGVEELLGAINRSANKLQSLLKE